LTYNLIPYNEENNPTNDAIGAKIAVYLNLNLGAEYKLTRELDLLYGFDFTHFSNGRSFTPNFGLNMYGINVGMRYYNNADQKKINRDLYTQDLLQARFKKPKSRKNTKLNENVIDVYLAIGTVQNEEDRGTSNRYATFSGVVDYKHKFSNMHAITGGFDLFYDESLIIEYPEMKDRFMPAIHAGYDFMFGKFTFRLQGGAYLGDDKGKDKTFIRASLQYEISKWMFAQAGLKTKNGSRADWAEFGIGFKPFKW
jgi:hypothetical protein